jgi:hypothetical protein
MLSHWVMTRHILPLPAVAFFTSGACQKPYGARKDAAKIAKWV